MNNPINNDRDLSSRPLRVGLVATPSAIFPPPPSHSITTIMEILIRGLIERGHKVTLFAAAGAQVSCELIPIYEKSIPLDEDPDLHLTRKAQHRTLQIIESFAHRFDIIHAHSFDIPNCFCSTSLLESIHSVPTVTTVHSCIEVSNIDYFLSCKNNLIAISKNQRKISHDINFISTVYNGLDPTPFPSVTEPENYLVFLGRMDRVKQPHLAIQLALQKKVKLKIAGPVEGKESTSYFSQECLPYLRHPLIEYLGELNMEEKIELLSKARCNLHPTGFREPFGLTVIEAAYCGTPTLAIRKGAMSELIENRCTGILVEDFAEGYHQLDSCFVLDRAYIAQQARKKFHYNNMVDGYLQTYYQVIKQFTGLWPLSSS